MRPLWPIERAVLETAALNYPNLAGVLIRAATISKVVEFENTGAGFFSYLVDGGDVALASDGSAIDGALGTVDGLEGSMSFTVFVAGGGVSLIEGYSNDGFSTHDIDFAEADFHLKPWSNAGG